VIGLLHVFTCKSKKKVPGDLLRPCWCVGPILSFVMALKVFFALKALPVMTATCPIMPYKFQRWGPACQHGISCRSVEQPDVNFVTLIGSLIHVYSIGNMEATRTTVNSFPTSTSSWAACWSWCSATVLLDVLRLECVGLCSYLLIGFTARIGTMSWPPKKASCQPNRRHGLCLGLSFSSGFRFALI
jgi:NADH-quinone oxidoreductase subunit L